MGRILRKKFRQGILGYRKFGSESNLLDQSANCGEQEVKKALKSNLTYSCTQCGHMGSIKKDEEILNNSVTLSQDVATPIRLVVNNLHSDESKEFPSNTQRHRNLDFMLKTLLSNLRKSEEKTKNNIIEPKSAAIKCNSTLKSTASWAKITRSEEVKLRKAPWYQPGLSREIATEVLSCPSIPTGSFFVRGSTTSSDDFALSVRSDPSSNGPLVAHYLIKASLSSGYRLKGSAKSFPTISSLVVHHSVMKEHLQTCLNLSGFQQEREPPYSKQELDLDEEFSSEDVADVCEDYPELISTLRKTLTSQ